MGGKKEDLCFQMTRGGGFAGKRDGLCYKNTLATYSHIHALGTPSWAKAMVEAAALYKAGLSPTPFGRSSPLRSQRWMVYLIFWEEKSDKSFSHYRGKLNVLHADTDHRHKHLGQWTCPAIAGWQFEQISPLRKSAQELWASAGSVRDKKSFDYLCHQTVAGEINK